MRGLAYSSFFPPPLVFQGRVISLAASQLHSIMRKSWQAFHDRLLLGRCFLDFVQPVLECCSAEWCSAADTHRKLLDRAVSGARFLTVGVFECEIAHRRSVKILCLLYKNRCNPVHPLNGALPVHLNGALHRHTYAPPRCRTSQYRRTYIPLSVTRELSC